MRVITNREKKTIAGGGSSKIFDVPPESPFDMMFCVSGDSQVPFLGYTHYANYVTDPNGAIIFQGDKGAFIGGDSKQCLIVSLPLAEKGVIYAYCK